MNSNDAMVVVANSDADDDIQWKSSNGFSLAVVEVCYRCDYASGVLWIVCSCSC